MSYKNHEKQKEYNRKWRAQRRIEEKEKAFTLLGGKCCMCGITDYRVLEIDHIIAIRRKVGSPTFETGSTLRQIIANGSRGIKDLQLLCSNCHHIKTYNELWAVGDNSSTTALQAVGIGA